MPPDNGWPTPVRAWTSVALLTLAYVLSFVDRQLLTLLVAPIQADLGLDDLQLSLLIGAAFALCYSGAGIPLGYLVDRYHRIRIASAGIAIWSVMTALCGLAGNYATLFAARMGVGLGEATLSPAAYSVMADSLPPSRLVRAVGIYSSGAVIGISTAYLLGGALAEWATRSPTMALPLVGAVRGWQVPFLLLLLPGMLLAGAVAMLPEPQRRQAPTGTPATPLAGFLRSHGLGMMLLFLGMGLQSVVVQSILAWGPAILARRYGWDAATIGASLGAALLIAGLTGNLGGAWLGSRIVARRPAIDLVLPGIASGGALFAIATASLFAASSTATVAFLALGFAVGVVATAPVLSAIQLATPGTLRGRMTALFLLTSQLIGLSVGPTLVAVFTEFVFKDQAMVGTSQALTAMIGAAASAIAFVAARGPLGQAMRAQGMDRAPEEPKPNGATPDPLPH